jgi:glucokinase
MSEHCLLVGDIGGTNARFALGDAETPGFTDEITLKCSEFESADAAIRHYLNSVDRGDPDVICLAAAGPIVDQRVRFTNNHWIISADELRQTFSIDHVRLLNDFEAIAYALPSIGAPDLLPIGLPMAAPLREDDYMLAIVGPGTGLGAVGLHKHGDLLIPLPGESSHGGFAPETAVQIEVLRVLRDRFDRVSTERLVSGPGLENIYWALTQIHNEKRIHLSPAEIFSAAAENRDIMASESVQMFFEVLGQFAGDFALTLGAFDGVFIGGGIAQRYPELVTNSLFRTGFERKGRYRTLMERIPTQLIMHKQPGLLGSSFFALQLLNYALSKDS